MSSSQKKVLSIGIRNTNNVGDVAITDMIAALCYENGYVVNTMDFNFKAVILELLFPYLKFAKRINLFFPFSLLNLFFSRSLLLKIISNVLKLLIYIPIIFVVFFFKSRGCGKVFIGGGNILMGIEHGFPIQALIYAIFSRFFGKKVYFVFVGAGPLTAPGVRGILRLALRLVHCVICRDHASKMLIIKELGGSLVDIEVMPDPVLLWPKSNVKTAEYYDVLFTFLPLFSPEMFPDGREGKAVFFQQVMVDLVVELVRKGQRVGFFVTDVGADLEISKVVSDEVFQKTGCRINIVIPDSPDAMAELVGSSGLVFSTRMHGAIMALSQSIPSYCIEWQPKVTGLYNDMGLSEFLIRLDDKGGFSVSSVLENIIAIQNNRDSYVALIDGKLKQLRSNYSERWNSL